MPSSTTSLSSTVIRLETGLEVSSPYCLGFGCLAEIAGELRRHRFDRLFLIADPTIGRLYGRELASHLRVSFACDLIVVEVDEVRKDVGALVWLCETLIARGATRDSILLAFGGGVVGNVVGLAAALLFRGIRFVEVPTTVLAQTDSVLSNKQAVNSSLGKNHFGVYHAPLFIWADTSLPGSDEPRRIQSGLVESVKNGLISDPTFLDYLDTRLDSRGEYAPELLHELIYQSVRSKLRIISRDPTEKGYCVVLEYGHTFGHALEKLSRGSLSHGEAVAAGMVIAADLSHELGYLDRPGLERHRLLLEDRLGLRLRLPDGVGTADLLRTMASDNKKSGKGVRYALLAEVGWPHPGDGDYLTTVDPGAVARVVARFEAGWSD